jgi:hypothetical protein
MQGTNVIASKRALILVLLAILAIACEWYMVVLLRLRFAQRKAGLFIVEMVMQVLLISKWTHFIWKRRNRGEAP